MGRKSIRDIRSEELIEATISAGHRLGFANITLADVAREADISPASVSYYFGSKDQLMIATMRKLLNVLRAAMLKRLAGEVLPHRRLRAMVEANFDDQLFRLEQCSIWMQFWAQAPYSPALSRLHHINRNRVRSNFRAELKQILPPEICEVARRAIQAYMDGVWLEVVQLAEPVNAGEYRAQALQFVEMILDAPEGLLQVEAS